MGLFSLPPWIRPVPGEGRRARSSDSGQSLVEMAMVLPILLALLVGIVEMGRAWNVQQVLVNAAREGARVGVLGNTADAEIQLEVVSRLTQASLDDQLATITITNATGPVGQPTSVQITYPYQFLFLGPVVDLLGVGGSIPGSINLSTTATMRHE